MFSRIPVLEGNLHHLAPVHDEARRAIRRRDRRVLAETQLREDSGDQGCVVGYTIEHGAVRTVVQGVKGHLEIDRVRRGDLCLGDDGDESDVVDVMVCRDVPEVGDGRRGVVGDGGGDI